MVRWDLRYLFHSFKQSGRRAARHGRETRRQFVRSFRSDSMLPSGAASLAAQASSLWISKRNEEEEEEEKKIKTKKVWSPRGGGETF